MNQDPLPYPLQMRSGGSLPTHLSLSLDTPLDASYWLQRNWLQPPPRTPERVIDRALRKDWPFECTILKYKQAAGLLPPLPLWEPILTRGRTCQEAAYQHWKRAMDESWEDKHHRQQAAACQRHLDKEAACQVANDSLASVPPSNARRPPVVNGFLTRRLHILNTFSMRRPLVALWPNVLLLHNGWQPPKPSPYGFAAAAFMSGLPTRLCGNSNARPLLFICDTSRTAAHVQSLRRSSVDRQLQHEQKLWPTRPPSNIATRRPHRKHWPRSKLAMQWWNALQQRRQLQ
jgi:hypothetical protein